LQGFEGFNIKSIGYGFLAIIPIGFVEPEGDKSLKEGVAEAGWTGGDWKSRIKSSVCRKLCKLFNSSNFCLTRSWVYGRNNLYNLDRIPRDLGL